MPDPATISADYTLHPGELASTLSLLVEARQPAIVYEPPGCAKSQITRQVADDDQRSKQRLQLVSPHRRFIDQGLYLPSIRSEGIDTIAVIIDTSASLPPQTLAEIWSEVREILLDESDEGQRLRSSKPFAGIVTEEERLAIIARHPPPWPSAPYDPSQVSRG